MKWNSEEIYLTFSGIANTWVIDRVLQGAAAQKEGAGISNLILYKQTNGIQNWWLKYCIGSRKDQVEMGDL